MTKAWQWGVGASLYALLGLTLLVYWPGSNGPLTLDDIANLGRLKHIGPINDLSRFLQFIFSSSSNYPARPLSFASFLINDLGWPLYVPTHKHTNLLIHLVNGTLVFWLSWLLCQFSGAQPRNISLISLTATALWLLAPLQVSTVLYVIQRMTELSALFVLCGLISYCYGRYRLNDQPFRALIQMTAGIVVFGILGFLCKENALLLTLYVLVIEGTLFRAYVPIQRAKIRRYFLLWQWFVLIAPIILALVLIIVAQGGFDSYQFRSFSAFERIASQPRILFDYLQNLLIPIRQGMGVTHDDYILSKGLLTPPSTLVSIFALGTLIGAALYMSRKAPAWFSFAVLWFIAGHIMESSIIPLEPYFEHRNYLPAFGPLLSLSYVVLTTRISVHRYLKFALVIYLVCFAVIARQNIDIWSSRAKMGEVWAQDHPTSVRAQQIRADVWFKAGDSEKAFEIIHKLADSRSDAMAPQIQNLVAACYADPDNIDQHLESAVARIPHAYFDHAVIPTLITLNDAYERNCPELTADDLLRLIDIVLNQDSVNMRGRAVSDLLYVKATILASLGQNQDAVSHLYVAFQQRPTYELGLTSTEFLYQVGAYKQASRVLDDVQAIPLKPWSPDNFRKEEIQQWRVKIKERLGR